MLVSMFSNQEKDCFKPVCVKNLLVPLVKADDPTSTILVPDQMLPRILSQDLQHYNLAQKT